MKLIIWFFNFSNHKIRKLRIHKKNKKAEIEKRKTFFFNITEKSWKNPFQIDQKFIVDL